MIEKIATVSGSDSGGRYMKPVSVILALFGLLTVVQPARQLDLPGALLGIVVLLCAVATFRSTAISSFLKIFVGIFSTETIVFGLGCIRWPNWPMAQRLCGAGMSESNDSRGLLQILRLR